MVTQATPSFSTQPRSEHEVTVEVQRRLRYEFVQAQALVLQGSAAIARVEPLALRDAVLVGSRASQLRFNELPLDVFRMLHALEWEPSSLQAPHPGVFAAAGPQPVAAAASAVVAATATAGTPATAQGSERVHPHKYVLHRATAAQVALVLATAMIELPPGGALLLYLSSDGLHAPPSETSISCAAGGSSEEAGHHKLATETPFRRGGVGLAVDAAERETCCLRPADLCPFCRMPLVLVVESDNAAAFRVLPHAAATTSSSPLLCLLAARSGTAGAVQCPQLAGGGLLTFFLHDPIAAFCLLGGVAQVPHAMHKKLATMLLHSFTQTTRALIACPETPTACLAFLSDPFLRTLILRFIFCHSTLRLFKPNRTLQLPESVPPMPSAVMLHDTTLGAVRQLAAIAGVVSQFHPTPLP